MKIQSGKNVNLSNIKTVVFYRWVAYIPTNIGKLNSSDLEALKRNHSSAEVFYLSSDSSSDLLDFSEYGFKINPEKDLYKSHVIMNKYDQETRDLARTDLFGYNFDVLNKIGNEALPQIRESEIVIPEDRLFFGMITDLSKSIIYLDVPGEEKNSFGITERNGVWKVELYNEYLVRNNTLSEGFIDYSVLSNLPLSSSGEYLEPSLTITFGPDPWSSTNLDNSKNLNMYYPVKGSELKDSEYIYYDETGKLLEWTNDPKWSNHYREITSRKVLYVAFDNQSSQVSEINLSYLGWEKSINPNRNQDEFSLRNDFFWATRDNIQSTTGKGEYLYDSNSGILLGTSKYSLDPNDNKFKRLKKRLKTLENSYLKRRVYKNGEFVSLNGNYYYSSKSGNLGENPIYSNSWVLIDKKFLVKDGGDPLSEEELERLLSNKDILFNLKIIRNSISSNLIRYNILVNDKNLGTSNFIGKVSFYKNTIQPITIVPNPGNSLLSIEINGKSDEELEEKLYKYDEFTKKYTFDLNVGTEEPGQIGSTDFTTVVKFNFIEEGQFFLFRSPIKIVKDYIENNGEEREINFSYLLEKYYQDQYGDTNKSLEYLTSRKDSSGSVIDGTGIKVYVGRDTIEGELEPSILQGTKYYIATGTGDIIDTYLLIDDRDSAYTCSNLYSYIPSIDPNKPELIRIPETEDYSDPRGKVYKVAYESIKTGQSKNLVLELTTKPIECRVIASSGVELSREGQIIEFGEEFEVSFYFEDIKQHTISWIDGEAGEIITEDGFDYSDKSPKAKLVYNNIDDVYTFSLQNITKDVLIKID